MIDYHNDTTLFRESLLYTEAETGFNARLIEKDYFCTVIFAILQELIEECSRSKDVAPLYFKGGTCLSKIHARFYRMSEDLDFTISLDASSARSQRSRLITPFKKMIAKLAERDPVFTVSQELTGHNNSTQYVAAILYSSLLTGQSETIKIEISLRELVLDQTQTFFLLDTLLLNPLRRQRAILPINIMALSCMETYAEKFRAALTRRKPAIRDFYDIDYGCRERLFDVNDVRLLRLVGQKLAVVGNEVMELTSSRKRELRQQVEPHLAPVLRQRDLESFDLDRAFEVVSHVAKKVSPQ